MVIEHGDAVTSMAADGTGWTEYSIVVRLLSDAAVKKFAVLAVPYASAYQHVELLYARVRHPDGTVVETQTGDAMEIPDPVTQAAPFYSDLKHLQLPIRSLRVGDTLEYKYRTVRTKAEAPGQFWGQESFNDSSVILSETFELRVPAGIYVNVWSPNFKPVESTEAATPGSPAQHVYRWSHTQLNPTVGPEADAAAAARKKILWTADQELDGEQGKLPAIAWTTFKSWEDLGDWYRSLEADRIVPDDTVKAKVAELISGKSTELDKVHALYDYVATNIRYIGVAFGIGRYQPHTAADILSNQYGDCKDKHTLLAAMLSAAGISSDAVLIGAAVRFNEAVPSPASFNHLITHLTLDGQPVWLDATAEVAPYGMLVSAIRDKQALVVPPPGAANTPAPYIARTPVDSPYPESTTLEATGSLDTDGVSTSHMVLTVRGDAEIPFRTLFRQVPPDKYDEVVQLFAKRLGFPGTTSNPEITRPTDTTQPFKLSFDYKREKAGDWDHLRTLAQFVPVILPRVTDIDPPNHAIQLGPPNTLTSHTAMKLPAGWTAHPPPDIHAKCAYGTFDLTFRFEDGTLYADRRLEMFQKKVPVSDWKTYKDWSDKLHIGEEPYIQLVSTYSPSTGSAPWNSANLPSVNLGKPSGNPNWLMFKQTGPTSYDYAPAPIAPGSAPGNPKADALIRSAYPLFVRNDLDGAQKSLDSAKDISPEQIGLWSSYGVLALRRKSTQEADADFQKELKLHPGQTNLYAMMEGLERSSTQREERRQTLRDWTAIATADPVPVTLLMSLDIEDGNPAGALKDLAAAPLAQDKRSYLKLQIVLGSAQIATGDTTDGAATLVAVLKLTNEPSDRNNAAYFLAKAGLELPTAEDAARRAIAQLSEQSNSWTLQGDLDNLHTRSGAIISYWDTLAWVLFREGKLDEARAYANAAWFNSPDAQLGEHLGDILAAKGDKPTALRIYQLALASVSNPDGPNVKQTNRDLYKSLHDRIDALQAAGIASTLADAAAELNALRTIPIGSHTGPDQSADYQILLKDGNIEALAPVAADKEIPGALAMISRADFTRYFPPDSHLQLVRTGQLTCRAASCELILTK